MVYKRILIAADSSDHSMLALERGFGLANQLGAAVDVVTVADPSKEVVPELVLPTDTKAHDKIMSGIKSELAILKKQFPALKINLHQPQGSPKKEIIAACENLGSDIIIMGSHGRTGLRHLLMGSVAEYVIRHSKVPVMVVSHREG